MSDTMFGFALGLAALPALAVVICIVVLARRFVIHRIQRLKGANPHRRAALAARLFASRRAYMWSSRRFVVALTVGADWIEVDRAEAALLDEFVPRAEPAARLPRVADRG